VEVLVDSLARRTAVLVVSVLAGAGLTVSVPAGAEGPIDQTPGPTHEQIVAIAHAGISKELVGAHDRSAGFLDESAPVDELGQTHVRVQQTHGGVRVWGAEAIAHVLHSGAISSITDNLLAAVNPVGGTIPTVSSAAAVKVALSNTKLSASQLAAPPTADRWIYRKGRIDRLVWRVRLNNTRAAKPSMPVVFVDAHLGTIVAKYDNLQADTGTGNTVHEGTVGLDTTADGNLFELKDPVRNSSQVNTMNHGTAGQGVLMTDVDNVWGDGTQADPASAGAEAAYTAAETYDYYSEVFGRDGIFDTGAPFTSKVHFGNNYSNAFWDGTSMTYGDGAGNADPLISLDVAGHEITHGITEATAGLVYSGEAGDLNEASSDILGTAVEFHANNPADPGDYLIGEKLDLLDDGSPLRYLDRPSRDGASADCWSSTVGNLDIHYGSGVANHFFYLLSEGSGAKTINQVSYNSPTCTGQSVTGIGLTDATAIWYRALTRYFTATTNYLRARDATLWAARDLFGGASQQYQGVCAAWTAVRVGTACDTPPPTVLQNGVALLNQAGTAGSAQLYTLAVPAGAANLKFAISGTTGDADLYVRFGSAPTTVTYDCRPFTSGDNETCSIPTASVGTYYVMLYGAGAFSGVQLVGSYTMPGTTAKVTPLIKGQHTGSLSGVAGSRAYYSLAVPAGATNLVFGTSSGTGNLDLYVRAGNLPTGMAFDCASTASGNSDHCTIAAPTAGTYFVMVYGRAAYAGATLVGSYTDPVTPPVVLTDSVPEEGLAGAVGAKQYFSFDVPAGATQLTVQTSGGTGDVDLYLKAGADPTLTSYDCRGYSSSTNETCVITNPAAGEWDVMLNGYNAYQGVSLVAHATVPSSADELIVNGGFEGSGNPWVLSSQFLYTGLGNRPHTGTGYIYTSGTNSQAGTAYQQFAVPAGDSNVTVGFWLNIDSQETTTTAAFDKLSVEVVNTSGTVLATLAAFSNLNKNGAVYTEHVLALGDYSGQTVRLRFRFSTDASAPTTFRVDDVSVR